ncbi:MAG: excisionase family DNA-binding protein [Bacteroidetes bacterium]|nr:excisionase family DNA-binding protein [Bacteroidota bacterium]
MSQIFTSLTKDEFQEMLQKSVNLALNKEAKEKSTVNAHEEFLTVDEACKLLRISKPTLYKRMEEGKIQSSQMGTSSRSRRLFNKLELLQSIKAGAHSYFTNEM